MFVFIFLIISNPIPSSSRGQCLSTENFSLFSNTEYIESKNVIDGTFPII